jgi:hypothetical protein
MNDSKLTLTLQSLLDDTNWKEAFNIAMPPRLCPGSQVSLESFKPEDVRRIWAGCEGERDEQNWVLLAELRDGRFASVCSGCDYTGWDCQASGVAYVGRSLEEVGIYGLDDSERDRLGIRIGGGFGQVQLLDAKTGRKLEANRSTVKQRFYIVYELEIEGEEPVSMKELYEVINNVHEGIDCPEDVLSNRIWSRYATSEGRVRLMKVESIP